MNCKRFLSLLLICVLLCTVFAGCRRGVHPAATEAPAQTAAPTEPTEEAAEPSAEPTQPSAEPTQPSAEPTEPSAEPTDPADPPAPPAESAEDVHPMLFHVTGADGSEGYLFGTIHAGDERMDVAYDKLLPFVDSCDALAVEFDVVAFEKDTDAQTEMMMAFLLTDGTTVDQHMPEELYARAEALLKEARLMPSLMKRFNLAMWSDLVGEAALITRSELDYEIGMDRRLIRHCYEKQIEVRDVESAELQYGMLLSFPDELNLLIIEDTLDSLDTYGEDLNELYEIWLRGDYDEVTAYLTQEDEADPEKYTPEQIEMVEDYNRTMLDDRNLGMRDRAVEWLEAGDKVFFAVGAAHLVGEAGLVELLRAAGYTVEPVEY